ncbi:AEC family transporter [Rhodomicrobium sp.]|uniref:AEC family transporter n=1 Tax=Rhodomicrobium sp. TaxID=2720632 RepID=UPI0039E58C16
MFTEIFQDVASIFFVLFLGYWGGRSLAFTPEQTAGFGKLVLNYALPATLFASIVKSTRDTLLSDLSLLYASLIVLLGWTAISFVVAKGVFKHDRGAGAIASLSASAPTVGFLGIAVLAPIFGAASALSVAIMSLVVNVLQVPFGIFCVAPSGTKPADALVKAIKQPVVLAPLLAVVLVLVGLRVPSEAQPMLELIGHATSGVSCFAAGLTLAQHKFHFNVEVGWNTLVKLVLMPATMLGVGLWFGMSGDKLREVVLLAALPSAMSGVIIAIRFQTYMQAAASTLVMTSILFAAAAPIWMYVTARLAG